MRIFTTTTALCGVLLATAGCPDAVPTPAKWTVVEGVSVHEQAPVDAFDQKEKERLKAEVARRDVERIRSASVQDKNRGCQIDSDCTVVSEQCCDCAHGGRKAAVNREGFQELIRIRTFVCKEVNCRQQVSDDETCAATRAQCVQGKCELKAAASPGGTPEGIGVETIQDEAGTDGPKGAPATP